MSDLKNVGKGEKRGERGKKGGKGEKKNYL